MLKAKDTPQLERTDGFILKLKLTNMKHLEKIKEFIGIAEYDKWGGGYI